MFTFKGVFFKNHNIQGRIIGRKSQGRMEKIENNWSRSKSRKAKPQKRKYRLGRISKLAKIQNGLKSPISQNPEKIKSWKTKISKIKILNGSNPEESKSRKAKIPKLMKIKIPKVKIQNAPKFKRAKIPNAKILNGQNLKRAKISNTSILQR